MSAHADGSRLNMGDAISTGINQYTSNIGKFILIGFVGTFALGVGGWGGFVNVAMKHNRGEEVEVGDVLYPFKRFGDFFIPALLIGLAACLCYVPGIILATRWYYAYPIMIETGCDWKTATAQSKSIVEGHGWATFAMMLVAGFIGRFFAPFTSMISGTAQRAAWEQVNGGGGMDAGPQALPGQQQSWGGPAQQQPAQQQSWGQQPAQEQAPAQQQSWGQQAAQQQGWGQQQAPAQQQSWGQQQAPAQQQSWGQQPAQEQAPAQQQSWGSATDAAGAANDAAAHARTVLATPQDHAEAAASVVGAETVEAANNAEDAVVETATQSTTDNPDEIVRGKTVAMSTFDFDKLLEERKNKDE